ncbi:MAG TPA: ABC transporter substrate-binding protein [Pseudolabrys sp.]|nr:ABC transporter substrate-binding protein [Pseudolabrys sp.]
MTKVRNVLSILALSLVPQIVQAADPVHLTVGYQPYDTISYSAVVIRGLDLWKKHLPPGSTVDFQAALQGAIIVNAMLADKQQIGYLGDMPAVVSTTKTKQAVVKLVASTGLSAGQRCNVIMVRADAPQFKSPEEAVKWLDGKVLATPRGSCADRFLRQLVEMSGIKPKEVLNQSIEVIATNFRAHRIDAAALWEPSVSRIGDFVGEGIAREVVTGHNYDMPDGGFIAMREDFMKKQPEIAKAWLAAELEAQLYLLDPKNWDKVAEMVKSQTEGITTRMAWFSLYGAVPPARGGSPLRDEKPFTFDARELKHLETIYTFLHKANVIDVDKAPAGAIDDSIAVAVAKEKGQATPLGVIKPLDVSKAPQ